MPFPFDKYPWLNFQELNLAYFIKHFREIFQQWNSLLQEMYDWKDATDAELEEWKSTVETGISSWETGLQQSMEDWKDQTEADITTWEEATLSALDAWKTATIAVFEQIRTEAAASAQAAAGSATAAQTALAGAQAAQSAAETAAAGIQSEAAQIQQNTADIDRLKESFENYAIKTNGNYSTIIPENTDFDTLVGVGEYRVANTASANTMINIPTNRPGRLIVIGLTSATKNIQLYAATTGQYYIRFFTTQSIWSAWEEIPHGFNKAEFDNVVNKTNTIITYKYQLQTGTDLNTLLDNGIYGIAANIRDTLINLPEQYTIGTANLIVQKGGGGGSGLVTTQFLITDAFVEGNTIYRRLLNMNTGEVISGYDWAIIGGTIETTTGQSEKHAMTQKAVTDALTNISNKIRWLNKKIVTFGDSRTWYDGKTYTSTTKNEWKDNICTGYQEYIKKLCGLNVINEGVSGDTSIQICNKIRNYDFSQCDAVFLEGGVNDFIKSSQVTIGTIEPIGGTFDTSTIYGAWQSAIEYILNNYPAIKIYMDMPAIAWKGNPEEIFPYNIAQIKKEISELYNIPCLDLYKKAGINIVNRDYYYADDTTLTNNWHLHFNDFGNKLIGEIIAEFINTH